MPQPRAAGRRQRHGDAGAEGDGKDDPPADRCRDGQAADGQADGERRGRELCAGCQPDRNTGQGRHGEASRQRREPETVPAADEQQQAAQHPRRRRRIIEGGAELAEAARTADPDRRDGERRGGDFEQQDEVDGVHEADEEPDRRAGQLEREHEPRDVEQRVGEGLLASRRNVLRGPSGQERVGRIPVIVAQIPVGVLAAQQRPRSEHEQSAGIERPAIQACIAE